MNLKVVDTNVILVANQAHKGISPECIAESIERLLDIKTSGTLVVDDDYRIVKEYQNKTKARSGKGVGDAFVKWALQNQSNPKRCQRVMLSETAPNHFAEFPDQALQPHFDPSDRMFAAVANAHPHKPPILQAADCKWLNWAAALAAAGVTVDFICPADVRKFYRDKFPGQPVPEL